MIKAKNVTAQLQFVARGNPAATHPRLAVGNFFPGLEFNFQNVWKRFFIGLELLEYGGTVIAVDANEVTAGGGQAVGDDGAPIAAIVGSALTRLDGQQTWRQTTGVAQNAETAFVLEWSNLLAETHASKGGTAQTVSCEFTTPDNRTLGPFKLRVRRLIEADTGLISPEASLPGEITESLCSPWQTDYIGCACYYWASNRPDFVNITEVERQLPGGGTRKTSIGNNWLDVARLTDGNGRPFYTLREENLLQHDDVMQDWENRFQFVVKGQDIPDGVVKP